MLTSYRLYCRLVKSGSTEYPKKAEVPDADLELEDPDFEACCRRRRLDLRDNIDHSRFHSS